MCVNNVNIQLRLRHQTAAKTVILTKLTILISIAFHHSAILMYQYTAILHTSNGSWNGLMYISIPYSHTTTDFSKGLHEPSCKCQQEDGYTPPPYRAIVTQMGYGFPHSSVDWQPPAP